ncbi:MAG: hypothetical protein IT210_22340 [Armatimonadetes bacterium]|nr:hypothetical protein [Armatimonadota bacterium]
MAQQKWSKERILEEIQYLNGLGKDLSHSRVQTTNPKLTSAAIRYFGSWKNAVEAAGVDYDTIREHSEEQRAQKVSKWSQERIVEEILSLRQTGEDLRASVIEKKYPALFSSASRYFGGWQEAIASARIDYVEVKESAKEIKQRNRLWSRLLILDRLSEMVLEGENLAPANIQAKYPALYQTAVTHFGSWAATLKHLQKNEPLPETAALKASESESGWVSGLVQDKIAEIETASPPTEAQERARLKQLLGRG